MKVTYLAPNDGSGNRCPNCTSTNWLRDDSSIDGIKLNTVPESMPGSLGCNDCGHSWDPAS